MDNQSEPPLGSLKKKEEVRQMFNDIAFRYDFLNHVLSFQIDKRWRKKLIRILSEHKPHNLLDVATGTGDLAITASSYLDIQKIVGIDISEEMLKFAQKKIYDRGLQEIIHVRVADSENMPFEKESFDACMVAFGVRNFENLQQGIDEMFRVLNPGGIALILEFSNPQKTPFKQLYTFYFRFILPAIGRWISKHNKAYSYLPDSVVNFPQGEKFLDIMQKAGFESRSFKLLTFGIATIYQGTKPH